jgi:glyoxylase-like metal-dependent hydrolase (beta-lactamase superfamily II)
MSEPKTVATATNEVVPGLWYWSIDDERIGGFIASAHAIREGDSVVLVDPLPLEEEAFRALGRISAICLTCGSHQRSAWRLRRQLGVQVYAPALVREVDEEPDIRYEEGDLLPGGLEAIFTPGAGTTQHAFMREEPPTVLFTADLFVHPSGEPLGFVPDEYLYDPTEARNSARKLLDLDFDVLCTGHGAPIVGGPKEAIRGLLLEE